MPVPLRANHHRAEAKFNVTTEFPSFGLHSAASTGNVGLVNYALSRGQPVNSVVDGVLPLHAACAGGNVQVVKLLIEYGADVNAPRLPKRYSSRDSSTPIIGTTGSTPLHFAAANGNREAIMLLLLHGAHADRPDKHGVTPEALARQHGWIECADDLKEWIINKDKDLRERAEFVATDNTHGRRRNRIGSFGDPEPTTRRRLHVKQSIDTALNMLKSSSSNLTEAYHRGTHTPTPPTSPIRSFGDYSSTLDNPGSDQFLDVSTRRPSLPHITQSDSFPRPRKPSAQSTNTQRPRSVSEDVESGPIASTKNTRRLGSKVSLLNLFRKGQAFDDNNNASNINLPVSDASSLSNSPPTISGPSLTQHRPRPHHDSDVSVRSRKTTDPLLERKQSFNLTSHSPGPTAADLPNASIQENFSNRDRSRSNASSRNEYIIDDAVVSSATHYHSPGSSPLARVLRSQQGHHRARSGSGSSLGFEVTVPSRLGITSTTVDDTLNTTRTGGTGIDADSLSRSLPRSGILRPHNRNGSNGQGHMTPSALRALRSDNPSSALQNNISDSRFSSHNHDSVLNSPSSRTTVTRLKSSNSVGSLAHSDSYSRQHRSLRRGSAGSMTVSKSGDGNEDGDAPIEEEQEGEEEYGNPIEATEATLLVGVAKAPSRGSISPITSNDHTSREGEDTLMADFPFSINYPPPILQEGDMDEACAPTPPRTTNGAVEKRYRGDSLSSNETSSSQECSQASSMASTTMVVTPLTSPEVAPPPIEKQGEAPMSTTKAVDVDEEGQCSQYLVSSSTAVSPSPPHPSHSEPQQRIPPLPLQLQSTHMHTSSESSLTPPANVSTRSISGRRIRTPFEIDISSISTHAQAEALVEKARQDVMELASQDFDSECGSDGRTPLSARLAVYGEILAIERRFRELEQGGANAASGVTVRATFTDGERTVASSANLLPVVNQPSGSSGYTGSLYSASSAGGVKDLPSPRSMSFGWNGTGRINRNSRPSTAEEMASRDMNLSLSSEQSDQSMRSPSELGYRRADTHHHQLPIPTLSVSDAEDNHIYQPSSPTETFITRSRTPAGDRELNPKGGLGINRMASLDGMGYVDDEWGSALYRVSTAPSPARLPAAQAQDRSAKKLSKMGISVADQAGISVFSPPVAGHSGRKFNVLKSFFKGGKS